MIDPTGKTKQEIFDLMVENMLQGRVFSFDPYGNMEFPYFDEDSERCNPVGQFLTEYDPLHEAKCSIYGLTLLMEDMKHPYTRSFKRHCGIMTNVMSLYYNDTLWNGRTFTGWNVLRILAKNENVVIKEI